MGKVSDFVWDVHLLQHKHEPRVAIRLLRWWAKLDTMCRDEVQGDLTRLKDYRLRMPIWGDKRTILDLKQPSLQD